MLVARPVAISWPWRGIRIVDTVTKGFKKQRLDGLDTADDEELEELPDPVFTPLNRYCK
jgi:succinate dehydrogenase flavin-adding protein (antitoxin of CptAB toxin-antitoxin module)